VELPILSPQKTAEGKQWLVSEPQQQRTMLYQQGNTGKKAPRGAWFACCKNRVESHHIIFFLPDVSPSYHHVLPVY